MTLVYGDQFLCMHNGEIGAIFKMGALFLEESELVFTLCFVCGDCFIAAHQLDMTLVRQGYN